MRPGSWFGERVRPRRVPHRGQQRIDSVRPGRIRTMRAPQAESLSRRHSNPRRRRGGFPDGRARSGRRFGHGRPASQASTRLLRARGHGAIVKARVVRPMRSPGALRAISVISCAMKLPAMDRPASCSTRQATKRTAELLPSAGRDRLPAPGKCGGSSTGKGETLSRSASAWPNGPRIYHIARYREMAVGKSQLMPCLACLLVNK